MDRRVNKDFVFCKRFSYNGRSLRVNRSDCTKILTSALSQAYILIVSELKLRLFDQNLIEFIDLLLILKALA